MTILLGVLLAATCLPRLVLTEGDLSHVGVQFTEPMIACFKQRKVYWGAKNNCYELPDRAACNPDLNQWLVLDSERINSDDRLEPKCKNRPCQKNIEMYWPASQSCRKMTKITCPKGTEVGNDLFGDGICECKKSPVHLPMNLTVEASECYELYTKGPCPVGQVIKAQHVNGKSYVAVCHPDPCAKYERNTWTNYAIYNETKQCHELNSKGPCNETNFQVSHLTYLPDCGTSNQLAITNFPLRKLMQLEESLIWEMEHAIQKLADTSTSSTSTQLTN